MVYCVQVFCLKFLRFSRLPVHATYTTHLILLFDHRKHT